MECRKLEITLVSANSLPDVRNLGRMKVYAKVSIKGGETKTSKKKTPVDMEGETNPTWNFPIEFTISESAIQHPADIKIVIKLYCDRTFGDKGVGKVIIPLKSLFDMGLKSDRVLSYQVAGTPNGRLNISYNFGDQTFFVGTPWGSRWKNALGVEFWVGLSEMMLSLVDIFDDDDDYYYEEEEEEDDEDDEGRVFHDAC
ncbi:hypothetical protein DH2020_007823 [Rehmannia glutinosa]|uniref:C2 domain-containing protein n=1 Tax=Rehmannia glutinosa TaxID=99300 RepID=A0ABR0TZA1_REHGL